MRGAFFETTHEESVYFLSQTASTVCAETLMESLMTISRLRTENRSNPTPTLETLGKLRRGELSDRLLPPPSSPGARGVTVVIALALREKRSIPKIQGHSSQMLDNKSN